MQTQHVFGRLNSDSADKDLGPEEYRDSNHLLNANGAYSKGFRREIIKGNELIFNNENISDQSKVIGTHEDRINNRVVYFIVDPLNPSQSGIYQFKDGVSKKILDNNGFDFNIDKNITQIAFTGQYMFFIDTDNTQYYFDTKRALETTELDGIQAKYLKLIKPRPKEIPTVIKAIDISITQNRIAFDSYKFFVRYVYQDNTETVISNASKVIPAKKDPQTTDPFNRVTVSISIEEDLKKVIKKVLFFYEKNDSGRLYEFESKSQANQVGDTNTYTVFFTGYETANPLSSIDSIKPYEAVPVKSNAGAIVKNTNFVNAESNDYDDDGDYDINLSLISQIAQEGFTFKSNGNYSVGIAFYDKDGRISPILKRKSISIPASYIDPDVGQSVGTNRIEANITGTMPSWATSYQLFISENSKHSAYFQCYANVLYYRAEFTEGDTVGTNEFVYGTAIYSNEEPESDDFYNFIHLQIPSNVPFTPDSNCFVRVLNTEQSGVNKIESVVEVKGDIVVVNNFGLEGGNALNGAFGGSNRTRIEIYKDEVDSNGLYYAYPEKYNISGTENRTIALEDSDTYIVLYDNYFNALRALSPKEYDDSGGFQSYNYKIDGIKLLLSNSILAESPTPTVQPQKSATLETAAIKKSYPDYDDSVDKLFPKGEKVSSGQKVLNVLSFVPGASAVGLIGSLINRKRRKKDERDRTLEVERTTVFKEGSVLNYQKSTNGWGFPNVYFEEYRRTNQSTVFYFSNPFIQNSNINGIGSFDQGNRIELPIERGEVTCLFPTDIDSSSVLLAFHDRNVTSIYVGEAFVRQNQDDILAKTEGVIGDERILIGGYGTVNPESVTIHNGRVYFWDLRAGEPVRYSRAGLTPLATVYKMRKEFNKWQNILQEFDPDIYKVNTGFDPLNNIFYISFPTVRNNIGETYLFSESDQNEGWITKLQIEPDIFAKNNNEFYSFRFGQMYLHNADVRANFYGQQKESSITLIHNESGTSEKIYENVSINSNGRWDVELNNRRGQKTDIKANELEHKDETFYGDFRRDINTPQDQLEGNEVPLLHGNLIKDQLATIKLSILSSDEVYLDDVGIGYTMVQGHNNKAKK